MCINDLASMLYRGGPSSGTESNVGYGLRVDRKDG